MARCTLDVWINLNMRCIEMFKAEMELVKAESINLNMRCIEIIPPLS